MSQPKSYQTEAIILKKTKLGEADRILTMLTPHFGKIQAVAKGVRNPKSKMSGHLELLTHSQVQLSRGRNLDTVTGCQTINSFFSLKNDLDLTAYALYLTELTAQFTTEHQDHSGIFTLLLSVFDRLCLTPVNREVLLRHFEIQLLDLAGYRPQLQQCVACRKPLQPVTNYFSAAVGGVLCPACCPNESIVHPLAVNTLKVLRILQNNNLELALKLKINSGLATELEETLRRYIRFILEREVKSVEWLDNLKNSLLVTDNRS